VGAVGLGFDRSAEARGDSVRCRRARAGGRDVREFDERIAGEAELGSERAWPWRVLGRPAERAAPRLGGTVEWTLGLFSLRDVLILDRQP